MKRFVFAVAAVALIVSVSAAQETPATTPPAGFIDSDVIVAPAAAPVTEAMPATVAPARRGLFGRLRGRGATTTVPATGPTIVTPGTVTNPGTVTTPAPTTTPAPVPMPMPMPGTKPAPSTMTTPVTPNGIVLASGATSAETTMVVPATATEPAAPRRGLFGRLRNR